ncbi:MAG: glycosyltransferase family 4 protein [Desulfobacterales bacterium]|jgi:glycosyltransferase involved in cell wall biosynthesis
MVKNIGFASTRFAGLDGVSLEAGKWGDVLESKGYNCFWFAGELDKDPDKSYLAYEAHFQHPYNLWINRQVFGKTNRTASVSESIENLKRILKARLQDFIAGFHIDLLIVENALAIPLNIPLGLALAELISETQIPTIAHHHDFYWERNRFQANSVAEYLHTYFPPKLSNIQHVVINSITQDDLYHRRSIGSTLIPNVLDFDNPAPVDQNGFKDFLASFGLNPGHKTILQPTRIIQRKGIEHAIDLVKGLEDSQYKLLISHEAGDEGWEYAGWIKNYALENGVDLRFAQKPIASPWQHEKQGVNENSLWNVYFHADLVTFPSLYEGFGNAFLEAIYFKKPLMINRYATFVSDIEPKGFDLVTMDASLTAETVQAVKEIIESPQRAAEMVNHNYEMARQHFSYCVLNDQLDAVMAQALGRERVAHRAVVCQTGPDANDLTIRPRVVQFANLKN